MHGRRVFLRLGCGNRTVGDCCHHLTQILDAHITGSIDSVHRGLSVRVGYNIS